MDTADVLVIGAGMAGLKSAHDLQAAGQSVIVIEARDRVGGRIHTVRDFSPVPLELGAELIHGTAAATWAIARSEGIDTLAINRVRVRGTSGEWQSLEEASGQVNDYEINTMPRDDESVAAFLARMGIQAQGHPLVERLEIDTAPIEELSAKAVMALLMEQEQTDDPYVASDFRIIGGYDQLPRALAKGLDIRLNMPVKIIEWKRNDVRVTCADGSSLGAPKLVITLPIGVLQARDVRFSPDLPAKRWAAIDAIGISDIAKLHFYFDQSVLPVDVDGIFDGACLPQYWWNGSSGYPHMTGEVLVGWAGGRSARTLLGMTEAGALQTALNGLRAMLELPTLTPRAARITRWRDDHYAKGAYTFTSTGAHKARESFAAPLEGTLFWAGEATDTQYATAHGAYRSGARAASEVLSKQRRFGLL